MSAAPPTLPGSTLILLRHADATAAPAGGGDFERALSARGQHDAAQAARAIATLARPPDRLLYSPAARALQTATLAAAALGWPLRAEDAIADLYLASAATLRTLIRRAGIAPGSVLLVVAHNPGLSDLAAQIDADRAGQSLPTAGFCVLPLALSSFNAPLERR